MGHKTYVPSILFFNWVYIRKALDHILKLWTILLWWRLNCPITNCYKLSYFCAELRLHLLRERYLFNWIYYIIKMINIDFIEIFFSKKVNLKQTIILCNELTISYGNGIKYIFNIPTNVCWQKIFKHFN